MPDPRGPLVGLEIADAALALLRGTVLSLEAVEILMHLRRIAPEARSIEAIARHLELDAAAVAVALDALGAAGLLVRLGDDAFTYSPATLELDAAVRALADAHATRFTAIVRALNLGALGRIRSRAQPGLF